jgi:DNA mismatch repair protein MutL
MTELSTEDAVIRVLDSHVVDHIAAGEVIERPSAVLKELLENAIDAGATDVRVEIEEGGLSRIRIEDDGCGMSLVDLKNCIKRHATSKIVEAEDLFGIETLGFRGEALSSISAVANVQIETKRRGDSSGWRLVVRGGEIKVCEEAPVNDGTTIDVSELFFNTPARRKFLRAPATEQSHVMDAALRVGMAQMHVALQVYNGNRRLLDLPSGVPPGTRLEAALGSRFPDAELFEHCSNDVAIQGFLAPPSVVRNDAKGIWVFVNGRYVRDRMFHRAVADAFQEKIPSGKHPVIAVYVDLEPSKLDVNVHPQKLEVRFSDGQAVFQAFSEALGVARQLPGWSDRESSLQSSSPSLELGVERALGRFYEGSKSTASSPSPRGNSTHRSALGSSVASRSSRAMSELPKTVQLGLGMKVERGAPTPLPRPVLNEGPDAISGWQQLQGDVAIRVENGTLRVLDIAEYRRVRWLSAKKAELGAGSVAAERRVIPVILEWPESRVQKVEDLMDSLARFGFKISTFEGRRVAILSVPRELGADDSLEELLIELCDTLPADDDTVLALLSSFQTGTTGLDDVSGAEALAASKEVTVEALRELLAR